jgi:hypothetical protein
MLFRSETLRLEGKISSSMNSNNPLAVEPETENDAGVEKTSVIGFRIHLDRRGALARHR